MSIALPSLNQVFSHYFITSPCQTIESGVNTPRVTAIIKECGGKMHLTEGSFDLASACFFSAFKHYTYVSRLLAILFSFSFLFALLPIARFVNSLPRLPPPPSPPSGCTHDSDASDSRNMMCLQYLVLSNMLMDSDVDPFKSQEAAAYKNNPEMQALITLLNAYQRFDLFTFEKTLKKNRKAFMEGPSPFFFFFFFLFVGLLLLWSTWGGQPIEGRLDRSRGSFCGLTLTLA